MSVKTRPTTETTTHPALKPIEASLRGTASISDTWPTEWHGEMSMQFAKKEKSDLQSSAEIYGKRLAMITTEGRTQASQQTTIERLLNDEQVLVHINPGFPGVVVPSYLMDNRTVTLRLSRYFKGRLSTNEREITAELLFGPNYFVCSIPWASIWGASSVRGEEFVWSDATPPDILHLVLSQEERNAEMERRESRPRVRTPRATGNHLRRVK